MIHFRKNDAKDTEAAWWLDFTYGPPRLKKDGTRGRRARYKALAKIQTAAGAKAEHDRLFARAVLTGSPYEASVTIESKIPTLAKFVESDAWNRYLHGEKFTKATRVVYVARIKDTIGPAFGAKRLDEIDFALVEDFANERHARGRKSRGPVNLLRTILGFAVARKVLKEMPALPTPKKSGTRKWRATTEEVTDLLGRARVPWVRAMIELIAKLGLRSGEIRALQVGDVNLATKRILVCRAYSEDELGVPKSKKSRELPIPDHLVDTLRRVMKNKLPGAPLLLTETGKIPTRRSLWNRLRHLERNKTERKIFPHMLRHYYLNSHKDAGTNIRTIQELAGHSSLSVTERYLGSGGNLDDAAKKVPDLK